MIPVREPGFVNSTEHPHQFFLTLFPIVAVIFVAFLVIGLALPVLPLHIRNDLGQGPFIIGLVAGAESATALVSRFWSGSFSDLRGAKPAVIIGLLLATASGLLYIISMHAVIDPNLSVSVLLIGRAILGAAESFIVTGSLSWALALNSDRNSGKVIAWVGLAMYISFACSAPVGMALYSKFGFPAIAFATLLLPAVALTLVLPLKAIAPLAKSPPAFTKMIGSIWMPGLGLGLSSAGFASITTFAVLLFSQHGWLNPWLVLTAFAGAFVFGRFLLADLPKKFGGNQVALTSLVVEAIGLLFVWSALSPLTALGGAMLTGIGYSMVYPGFGVEVLRRTRPENRGLAMGAYTAFLDLALGLTNPFLGWLADQFGIRSVFLVAAILVLYGGGIAVRLILKSTN
jgi:MFS family permease